MHIKYKNELLVLVSIIFLIGSYIFKTDALNTSVQSLHETQSSLVELQEAVSLEKIWSPKDIKSKLKSLRSMVNEENIQWKQRGKKISIKFIDISSDKLNKILNKVLNIAIQIEEMKIIRDKDKYTMELKCKW
jgi:preprotein translocase subunit SecF